MNDSIGGIFTDLFYFLSIISLLAGLIMIVSFIFLKFFKKEFFLNAIEEAIKNKEYKKALDKALLYLKEKEGNSYLYYYIGEAYEGLSQHYSAIENYEKALAIEENEKTSSLKPELLARLGHLYQQIKKYEEAIGYYRLILKINPRNLNALWNLAEIYYDTKKYNQAKEFIEKYIFIKQNNPGAYYLLSRINFALEDYQNSIKNIEKFFDLSENISPALNKEALLLLSDDYIALHKYTDAYNILKGFLSDKEHIQSDIIKKMLVCLINMNSFSTAIQLVNDYLLKVPPSERCSILYEAGKAYLEVGEVYKALEVWDSAYQIDPKYLDLAEIRRKYDVLKQNLWLENIFSNNIETFEDFCLRKLKLQSINNIMERQKDFYIFLDNLICSIIYRRPSPVKEKTFKKMEDILKNYGYSNLSIDLYSLFGVENVCKDTLFYKKLKEISGDAFIEFFKES